MAGPRKAQYVSIPLGPGVLSNTTGRGARTRINYMNWDRWKDANWVRWHKLLPEKQGGWQYQSLLAAGAVPQLIPGSPALLLHLNAIPTVLPVSVLLHMNGSFADSSPNHLTIAASGTAVAVTTGGQFGGRGVFTQSGGISVPITTGGACDLGTGDQTMEFWINPTVDGTIVFTSSGFYGDTLWSSTGGGLLAGSFFGSSTNTLPGSVPPGVWTAVAYVIKAGLFYCFVNGVLQNSPLNITRTPMSGFLQFGGRTPPGGIDFGGSLDELRITPFALYTANYTPSAVPLTPTIAIDAPDFTDSSPYHWPMTPQFGASIEMSNPKFGNGALALDGAAAVLTTPLTPAGPLDLSTTDFTVELWAYSSAVVNALLLDMSDGQTSGFSLQQLTTANVRANIWNGASYTTLDAPLAQNAWTATALVRAGNVFTLYTGGVAAATVTLANSLGPMGGSVGIGGGYMASLTGDVDEVRITPFALYTTNYTPATAENTLGLPNTLGSATAPVGFIGAQYLGIARDLHDWSSIDGQYWIAVGTHLKLYVVNQATLYDVTPQRKTSNVTNALQTVSGSHVVTVTDAGHQAATGDFVTVTGAAAVGGITLAGGYQIVVVDPNTYTVVAAVPATAGATGGGSFSIAYDIGAGLPSNGELLGYGTGPYGLGTYGTPRPAGSGVFARMRTWSLDNYGQDLVASQSDGEIYIWQRNSGPNSRAILLVNAPQGVQRVIVDAQQRVIIALGCTDVTSNFDAMLVRWCSFDDITDWVPTDVNTAGDDILVAGSRIITGLKTKGQNLIFTDTTLYRMVFVGSPDIYDFIPAGTVTIVGPNAAVDVDGVAYLMGFDNFYNYAGTLNLQACDVWETVFDPNVPTSLNRAQSEGVVCYTYEPKTEITWLYPSIGGAQSVAFTGPIAQGAVSATLAAPWTGTTGLYNLQFDDQEAQPVQLTAGATTATWKQPLVGLVGASAVLIGNDRYVTFNWEDGTWYYGAWYRTAAQGRAPAMQGYPYGVNAGYLYQHEVGTDAVEAAGTRAIGFSMTSLDITTGGAKSEYTMGGSDARFAIGGSDSHLLLRSMLPDWVYFTGAINLTLFTKDRPQDADYVQSGPVTFDADTAQIDIDANGSQLVIQLDNFTDAGQPSLGCSFRMGIFQGLAVPYVKR